MCIQYIQKFVEVTVALKPPHVLWEASMLKGPKREIFGLGIFAQIRPIWIGYLATRPKNPKKVMFGALYCPLFPEIFVLAL